MCPYTRLDGAEHTIPLRFGCCRITPAGHTVSASIVAIRCHLTTPVAFVNQLYTLRDSIAGCVGGMLSVAATSVKLFISVPERKWFRIRKVAGVPGAIVSSDGTEVDIDLGELRIGEKREMLVEVEMGGASKSARSNHPFGGEQPSTDPNASPYSTATDEFFLRKVGLNPLQMEEYSSDDFLDDEYQSMIDEVPLFEVNASYRDPIAGKFVSRLPYPVLLLVTITPPTESTNRTPQVSDPCVVRRRIELLCSDMETRCLLLMSRRNPQQAQRLLTETRRIVCTLLYYFQMATSLTTHEQQPFWTTCRE